METSHSEDENRLRRILEACYAALGDGAEPDIASLCAHAPHLRQRIERLVRRERELVALASAPEAARTLPPMPKQIGDFTVLEPIGVGGMSHVYRARQEPLGREVALKVLNSDVLATDTGRLRFQREASITAALDHPHIVPVFAAGEAQGQVYLAMKLLRGRSLDRLGAPMPPLDAARIGLGVAQALQAAHDVGVVHRDVKPANVMLEAGHVYVVDFGLAAFANQTGVLTRPDSTPGTLVYMAPELARHASNGLDPRVDVYGLGVTLYEVLAGHSPFPADNPVRTLHHILHVDPPPLGLRGRERDLETIVMRAIEKLPQRRFQTAGQMASELEAWLAGRPILSRRIGWIGRSWRLARRYPVPSSLALVVLGLALTLTGSQLAWYWEHQRRHDEIVADLTASIAKGDLVRGFERLRELSGESDDTALTSHFADELGCERQLQLLIGVVQSPTTQLDGSVLTNLADAIGRSAASPAQSVRADAALALVSRLLHADRLEHRPLHEATRQALPRTAAALSAWANREPPQAALDRLGNGRSDPLDHLFAAMTLRLDNADERDVERELRRSTPAESIHFSLGVSLETQGRHQEAYDAQSQLVASATYAPFAHAACARLAALLQDKKLAHHHMEGATAASERQPQQRLLVALSELQVRRELGEHDRFWELWNANRSQLGHLAQFWLQSGYERVDADPDAARHDLLAARQCATEARTRAVVDSALVQLEWREAHIEDLEPFVGDELTARRPRLVELARRGEDLAARATAQGIRLHVAADALLVASQAWRAVGERQRSWALLERTCREFGENESLATYANQVGSRIVRALEGEDHDAACTEPLAVAAAIGLARAQRVLERIAARDPVDPAYAEQARQGAFLCALHLGDATVAIPLAVAGRQDLGELADLALDWGGVWLDRLEVPDEHLASLLQAAIRTLQNQLELGRLDRPKVAAALARWRHHEKLQACQRAGAGCWREVWDAVAALEARCR